MDELLEVPATFVHLLRSATDAGSAQWARARHDEGFVYCVIEKELIVVETSGVVEDSDGRRVEPVSPDGEVDGMLIRCRNVSYLYLPEVGAWSDLLHLVRAAPVDDDRWVAMRREAHDVPVRMLKKALQ